MRCWSASRRSRCRSRTPRGRRAPGEKYGRHYYFVERAEFEREVAEGIFLEHAEVHGNLYGTSRTTVQELLAQGRDVLLEIDWQGAEQIRRSKPDCVSVFILPPSRVELERRLRGRGSDSAEVIERRLHNSRGEIAHAHAVRLHPGQRCVRRRRWPTCRRSCGRCACAAPCSGSATKR